MYNSETKKASMPHPTTDPFMTNTQKAYYNETQEQKKQQPQQQTQQTQQVPMTHNITGQQPIPNPGLPIINLQMYQPPKPQQPKIPDNQQASAYYNRVATLTDPLAYAQYQQMQQGIIPMIHKEYNFTIGGVSGSHTDISKMYENILPVKNPANIFNSLDERITLYEGIRSTLFPQGDGANTAIDPGSLKTAYSPTHELISHIKLIDMNPYSLKKYTSNPYDELPDGFLLYRSCYPIKHDSQRATSVCAPNSTGVNVRVYKLTEGSYMMKSQNSDNKKYFDEWRDIAYYEYVRDKILKQKICPNFVMLYGYTLTLHSGIDFNTKNLKPMQHPINYTLAQQQYLQYNAQLLQSRNMAYQRYGLQPAQTQKPKTLQDQLNEYTGKVICALTEAPNYNIMGWARKEYRTVGNIHTMVSSGYYSKNVWLSILFQLYVAISVMQLYEIYFDKFSFEKHVFIKDVQTTTNSYWIYRIKGIDYYIPNHGYVVLIDTNFRDYEEDKNIKGKEYDTTRDRKINGTFIEPTTTTITSNVIKKNIFDNIFKVATDTSPFTTQTFINMNGVKPPQDILDLLATIKNDADTNAETDVSYYIKEYFTMFLHNRVGTLLNEKETTLVSIDATKNFKKGSLVPYSGNSTNYTFVIYIDDDAKDNTISNIFTKDTQSNSIIQTQVPKSDLFMYSVIDPILQTGGINNSFTQENLHATYIVC